MIGIARAITCFVLALSLLAGLAGPAGAQQRIERRSILDFLFGRRAPSYPTAPPAPKRVYRPRSTHSRVPSRTTPAADTPAPVEKRPDAKKVLVIGDFMAAGLASGLDEAFADSPGVVIDDETNGSSGLVRDDYYNWPAEAGPLVDKTKPAAVVVLLGSNDRQNLTVNGTGEAVRSDAWTNEYTKRAEALAKAVGDRKVPLLWVGTPALQSPAMSADILAFNGIYRTVAGNAGGEFVDTWDGFVDENGGFVFTGSDVNGQPVRLRGQDGISLTAAGKRKLALYVEKPLRRILGDAADKELPAADGTGETQEPVAKLPSQIDHTDPIALDDPSLDGDRTLLGGSMTAERDDPLSPRALLVNEGRVIKPPADRADFAGWDADPKDAISPAKRAATAAKQFGPPMPPPRAVDRRADAGDLAVR